MELDFKNLSIKPDGLALADIVYQLWWQWADFEIIILDPSFPEISPPQVHTAEPIPDSDEYEFVYPIHDHGYKLLTSKQEEALSAGHSMCKLYYTIEKMIAILIDKLDKEGVDAETEVQIAFGGHELAQRKGFESVINLKQNVVVTNFNPGSWGEKYLKIVQNLEKKGKGLPATAPRDIYKRAYKPRSIKPT